MTRTPLMAAATLMTIELHLVEQKLDSGEYSISQISISRQIMLAADSSLKYVSEDSPYMRSERSMMLRPPTSKVEIIA
jgi:hypothetical protein